MVLGQLGYNVNNIVPDYYGDDLNGIQFDIGVPDISGSGGVPSPQTVGGTQPLSVGSQPDWLSTLSNIFNVGVGVYGQKQLVDINADRLRQGLPPLSDTSALSPQVNVGISPQLKQMLLFGGIAIVALLLLKRR